MRQEFDDMLTEMICYGEYLDYQPTVKKFVNLPEIVCLCGSTRFMKEFEKWNLKLTLQGKIVLSVGCNTKNAGLGITAEDKAKLDELHKRKIDLADTVLVLNVNNYIGESTKSEIEYAKSIGKPVYYLETPDALKRQTEDTVIDKVPQAEHIVFNDPATVVFWDDGTKTVVKVAEGDKFSEEYGMAMAYMKKIFGSNRKFKRLVDKFKPATRKENKQIIA